ncbi:putative diguanylate cyclase with Mase1 and PAS domains [Cupriavidus taiwanensis]|uniref:Diguanylate cyclase with Mase1 and PAS domains n=2 Tax=Cupriavidus taiwanensis TaxID=164546 RepID=A0A976AZ23_9BURK|nr:putative diguanylate cyclase with Mase1 and PAS domains [Cupriavidus taiwanensis]SOZ61191.1 putative diguanylate cyclase with Mase1 and PAS domains [Cupriavidus taiwanensis]SOZ65358.1 putative diguanylate cyclase with Mase1 and PAS domains [Cupriavidus taiwanensis]SPA06913.1 putative diguanylate cyclase with Mase1 and PAS domains [Cupriavidus taiwanensis]
MPPGAPVTPPPSHPHRTAFASFSSMTPDTAPPSPPAAPAPSAAPRRWLPLLLAGACYFVLAAAALWLARLPGTVASVWLPNAFGLGLLLQRPRAEGPWLLAGMLVASVLANHGAGDSVGTALMLTGANLAEMLSALLLLRLLDRHGVTGRHGPLAAFALMLAVGGILAPMVGASAGAAAIAAVEGSRFAPVWWTWWQASALGMALLLPLMLSMTAVRVRAAAARPMLAPQAGALALSLAIGAFAQWQGHDPFAAMSLPLVLLALAGNPFATALLALVATLCLQALMLLSHRHEAVPLSAAVIMVLPVCIAYLTEQNRHGRASLRSSDKRFRQAMEHSAIGMALVDMDGRWQTVNRAMTELLGYSAAELRELSYQQLTHPDDLTGDLRQVANLLSGKVEAYRLEKRYRHKDGHYRWVLLAVSLVRDEQTGAPQHFITQVEDIHARKLAQQELERLSRRIQLAVEAGGVGIWEWDLASAGITWDARMHALHGTDPAGGAPLSEQWIALLHPDDVSRVRAEMRRAIRGEAAFDTEYRIVRPGGEVRHVRAMAMATRDADGTARALVGTNWDTTEQRRLTEALFEEKERLHITLRSIGDAVICTDATMHVTFMNPIAEQLTGWTMAAATGLPLERVFRIVDESTGEPIPSPVEACLRTLTPAYLQEGAVLHSLTGERHDVQDSAAPVLTARGEVLGAVLVFQDITAARALQRELARSAMHDALTGLPNRTWFEKRLRESCDAARLHGHRAALCFIDLDRFKIVNDTAGHGAGDVLLRELGYLIRNHVRPDDVLARLGGDEFALLLKDCTVDQAEQVCQGVIDAIRGRRFPWEGRVYDIGASIGIAAIDLDVPPVSELMSRADVACYAAKAAGRSRVSVYRRDESDARRHHRELEVAAGIHSALEANRFRLFAQEIRALQPEHEGNGSGHRHIEILVRMVDEHGELILPGAFIPAAERYDLMGHVDRWVIRNVLRGYGERLGAVPGLSVSINLSANSLGEPFLLPFLHAELEASALPASRIRLEITETALINNMAAANRLVAEMRRAGCTVSLDDFGSGLSSFAYLKQFPVDYLKIDGSFIRQLADNAVDREIVSSINDIGHRLGVRTVAEWVEDERTLDALRAIGVDYAQGYAIGRPVALDVFLAGYAQRNAQAS